MREALADLADASIEVDALRIRAFPFHDEVVEWVGRHEHVFVVEQNRDGQLRTLLVAEAAIDPGKLTPVLHFDGTPITARFIQGEIAQRLGAFNVTPIKKTAATGGGGE